MQTSYSQIKHRITVEGDKKKLLFNFDKVPTESSEEFLEFRLVKIFHIGEATRNYGLLIIDNFRP